MELSTGEASADGGSSGSSGSNRPTHHTHQPSETSESHFNADSLQMPKSATTAVTIDASQFAASVPLMPSSEKQPSCGVPAKDEDLYVSIPTCHVMRLSSAEVDIIFSASTTEPSAIKEVVAESTLSTPSSKIPLRPAVLSLSSDAFSIVATFCDDRSLLAVGAACKGLRHATLRGIDVGVWRSRCEDLWKGKLHFDVTSLNRGVSTIPAMITMRLARATTLLRERPAPPSLLIGLAHSWRAAYFVSKADAAREFMTDDELFEFNWSVRFSRPFGAEAADAAEAATRLPPAQVFRRIGRRNVVQAASFLPEVPCQLYDGGRRVQVDIFPAHTVQRDRDTWGWKIANAFVTFTSAAIADAPATPPASPAPPPTGPGSSLVHVASL